MRQVVLDTETTGLDPTKQGHRIIEVAAIELINRRPTGRFFHEYLQPDREIDAGAQAVHGITATFLADKPRFADIAQAFVEFVSGAELIIHNAPFDLSFLDAEFGRIGFGNTRSVCPEVTDTLRLAKTLHPGKRNNLNALCERHAIDNSGRKLHGAMLDAELLAEVYLAMTRGQDSLIEEENSQPTEVEHEVISGEFSASRLQTANLEEVRAHQTILKEILEESDKGTCLWLATVCSDGQAMPFSDTLHC